MTQEPSPKHILETTFDNPQKIVEQSAAQVCKNKEWLRNPEPVWEWTPILDPEDEFNDDVGLSGWAVNTKLSGGTFRDDMPFAHPFGNDWEFWIVPDKKYTSLLAPSNKEGDTIKDEYRKPLKLAKSLALPGFDAEELGVLGVETDQDLVPEEYRAKPGDRVAVFGRWIADCGHEDFHTEIHPPLLLAVARASSGDETSVKVIGRPFLVSQEYGDGALHAHLLKEVAKAAAVGIVGPFALAFRIKAQPRVISPPFSGTRIMHFDVRPPTPRHSPGDTLLLDFHFTIRSGVTVQVMPGVNPDEIRVIVVMNESEYKSANQLLTRHDVDVFISELSGEGIGAITAIVSHAAPLAGPVLTRGILTDRYDPPQPKSILDSENVVTNVAVDQMQVVSAASIDDDQPFPIYGSLSLRWRRFVDPGLLPTILISAKDAFVNTGVVLEKGATFSILASGQWSNGGDSPTFVGPDGFTGFLLPGTILESVNLGSLIGRIGEVVFPVGGNFSGESPASGELFLGMNDVPGTFDDNLGELKVVILR